MDVNKFCVSKDLSIIEGIKIIDEMARRVVFVTQDARLIGVVTDGDIRRWILQNGDLKEPIKKIMNQHPIFVYKHERGKAKRILVEKQIGAIPIIDKDNKMIDIVFWNDDKENESYQNADLHLSAPVVIMAGGKGTRLYPYTKILPKPLIPIGDMTIIERIMNNFETFGCNEFYLTVNYKKNMIKAYLEEKSQSCKIEYVEEEKFLGTGGSLYLLKNALKDTFFVSNCDILIDADYADIINYHKENGYKITMVTSLKNYVIPYGVVEVHNGGNIKTIEEKPEYNLQVNTGLYVLEPEVIADVPENEFYHITELINQYIIKGEKVGVYPITGNAWLDMGEIKEMEDMIQKLKL
ncbi:MAG: Nucleotidyl transferase [Anaerocolumna sp.]|jgi:dTDP-glucose pyrophosphorylase|nr:Nucleotidyl transferase [Anaerocolumna sp.]